MKGLEVARNFVDEWGLPYLRAEFPHISERAACFLFGGSQSLGNDDELSRDHSWGPLFSIVLVGQDMRRFGRSLRTKINQAAPKEWLGFRFRKDITVDSLNVWFRKHTKHTHPPKTTRGWGRIHHENLYMLRHATVFHDPLGEFCSRRESFGYYPREYWLGRVTGEVFNVWHYGQYNFLDRLSRRGDATAISICLGAFTHATMRLCMYLNEEFAPYWKWLAAEFRKQPNVAELDAHLSALATATKLHNQIVHVDAICKDVYARLVAKNLVSENPKGHPHPLMCAQKELGNILKK